MRLVHLLRPAQGGMLQHVRSLLTDPQLEALLAAPPEALRTLADATREPGFPLPASDSPKAQLRGGLAAGRWARRVGAQLLHGHGLSRAPLYALAARRSGLPLIVTLHNLVPERMRALERLALRVSLGRAHRIVAVSEAVRASAAMLVDPARLIVVRNGIDLVRFTSLPDRLAARRAVGLPDDARVVLCVARLSPEKGVEVLASALHGEGALLLVAGDGPGRAALAREGTARLLGHRDDIPLLMSAADVYCQPSRQEGLGLAAMEAQAAGVPVVATRVGGLPEAVEDGVTGVLVSPDDPAALRAAIRSLLDDPERARALGAAGRLRAGERFGLETARARLRAVYAERIG